MNLPDEVEFILNKLNKNNFKGYVVGGCVRDVLLGKSPKDWDITTNAKPEEIKSLFEKTIDTGLKHGTVTVVLNNNNYEITTFRIDGKYLDNRKPDKITFTSSLKEDLSRRDFTINSIVYNPKEGLIDYYGGINDLSNNLIRTVGNPDLRFNEDALRMMRAVRFASQLNFFIDKDTILSIVNNRYLINNISTERIRDELCKILTSDKPSFGINLLWATGLLNIILPEIVKMIGFNQRNPAHHKDVYEHTLLVLDNTSNDLILRLSALLHDIGKPETFSIDENGIGHFYKHHMKSMDIAKDILQRLKFDNKTIEIVCIIVKNHMSRYDFLRDSSIKKFINRVGVENLDRLFQLQIADIKGCRSPHDFSQVLKFQSKVNKILNEKQPLTVKDLAINGYDLMAIGIEPGVRIGKILNELLEIVLKNPELNTKEKLLQFIKTLI